MVDFFGCNSPGEILLVRRQEVGFTFGRHDLKKECNVCHTAAHPTKHELGLVCHWQLCAQKIVNATMSLGIGSVHPWGTVNKQVRPSPTDAKNCHCQGKTDGGLVMNRSCRKCVPPRHDFLSTVNMTGLPSVDVRLQM